MKVVEVQDGEISVMKESLIFSKVRVALSEKW